MPPKLKIMKIYLLFILMLTFFFSFAQSSHFKLQASGVFIDSLSNKNYTVFEYPGKTKADLYTLVLKNITRLYLSPKSITSKVENEIISINAVASSVLPVDKSSFLDCGYILTIQFKDGKIKVDAPSITSVTWGANHRDVNGIFGEWMKGQRMFVGKKGYEKLNKPEAIDYFTRRINAIVESIVKIEPSSDQNW